MLQLEVSKTEKKERKGTLDINSESIGIYSSTAVTVCDDVEVSGFRGNEQCGCTYCMSVFLYCIFAFPCQRCDRVCPSMSTSGSAGQGGAGRRGGRSY